MLRNIILIAALLFPSINIAAPITIRSTDLKSLIESKNERVLAKKHEKDAAEYRKGYFLRSFLPKIEIYGAQESFRKGTHVRKEQAAYGAEANINLFNGGRDMLEASKRSFTFQRKEFEKQTILAEEIDKARGIYWNIIYLQNLTSLLKEARSLNDTNLKSASRRLTSGVATEVDRVEFEMKEIDLKREFTLAELELQNHKKILSAVLGFDPTADLKFSEELDHEHRWEETLIHSHDEHNFLAKPKELMSEEQLLEARIKNRSYWPKLDAFAGWNQFTEREEDFVNAKDRRESVVGLRLSMDFFDGFNSQKDASALRSEAAAISAESNYQKRELEIHIHNELAELKLLHEQVHEAEENIKRASRYYSLTKSEYARGVKNSPDVLGATEKLYGMKQKHLAIIRDFQIAKSHILSKIGK